MYAMASKRKHALLADYGATLIDHRFQDFAEIIRQAEPNGLDVILDGMMRLAMIRDGLSLLRRGGRMVSFGEPASRAELFRILGLTIRSNLAPNSKSLSLYGTSTYFSVQQETLSRRLGNPVPPAG